MIDESVHETLSSRVMLADHLVRDLQINAGKQECLPFQSYD